MNPIRHGTRYAYTERGCRCDLCTAACKAYCRKKSKEYYWQRRREQAAQAEAVKVTVGRETVEER